jgi:cell division protein FtsQ
VKTQRSNTTRSFAWDDEAPEEPLSRRGDKIVPPPSRALPKIPLEMDDVEEDELPLKGRPRFGGGRFDGANRPRQRKARVVGRVFLALAAVGGLAACAFLLNNFLSSDARFRITGTDKITATGLTEVSRAELLPVFGEDIGRNIFFIPLGERRRQLEEIPWVEKATVMRLLPDQIRVSLVERQPVAFVRQGAQIVLVDANGILLTMPAAMMAQRHYSFPVVTGIDANDPPALRKARMAIYQRLLGELDSTGQKLSEQISEIDLSDPADARVLMPEQDTEILAHFGQDHFLERYQRYKEHIAEWRQQYPKLATVDLRYDQQVVLEMATGNALQGATGEQSAESANADHASSGQVAENGQVTSKSQLKHASAAKAHKPAGKGAAKVKAPAAKKTNAKTRASAVRMNAQNKKPAAGKHAALNVSTQKTAPTTPAVSSAGQGQ